MASRRLAFGLNQALRSRQALQSIQPVRRFASPVSLPSSTQATTLSNGFTVCDCGSMAARVAWLGLLMSSRSRPSTRHGLRLRPLACGSTPVAEQRPISRTEPRTSWSTWPSRYRAQPNLAGGRGRFTDLDLGHKQAVSAPIGTRN